MTHFWKGIQIKIERAKEHIDDLRTECDKFLATNPYLARGNFDSQTGEYVITAAVREQPALRLGAIAGDAAHNLRSALDLLMWQLDSSPNDNTAFPILPDAKRFETLVKRMEQQGRWSDKVARLLEGLKPYNGGNNALWSLHRIDITDKHHVLMPIGTLAEGVFLVNRSAPSDPFGRRFYPNILNSNIFPLKDGAEVLRLPVGAIDPKMHVEPEFICDIAFAEPEVVKGKSIVPTLTQLANYIEAIIKVIAPDHVLPSASALG